MILKIILENQNLILGFLAVDPVLFTHYRTSALEKTLMDIFLMLNLLSNIPATNGQLASVWILIAIDGELTHLGQIHFIFGKLIIRKFFSELFWVYTTC